MAWTLTDDMAAYEASAGDFLAADPVRNTVMLSILASLARIGPHAYGTEMPLFGWWLPDDAPPAPGDANVTAAILQTPPHAVLITTLPGQAATQLARALADRGVAPPGINGAEQDAARARQRLAGRSPGSAAGSACGSGCTAWPSW